MVNESKVERMKMESYIWDIWGLIGIFSIKIGLKKLSEKCFYRFAKYFLFLEILATCKSTFLSPPR